MYIYAVGFSFNLLCKSTPEYADVPPVVYIFMRYFQPRLSEQQMKRRPAFLAAFQGLRSSQTCMCLDCASSRVPVSTHRFVNSTQTGVEMMQGCQMQQRAANVQSRGRKRRDPLSITSPHRITALPSAAPVAPTPSLPFPTLLLPSASVTGRGDRGSPQTARHRAEHHRHGAALGWFIYPPCGDYLWSYRTLGSSSPASNKST